jgi:hypothetical protein
VQDRVASRKVGAGKITWTAPAAEPRLVGSTCIRRLWLNNFARRVECVSLIFLRPRRREAVQRTPRKFHTHTSRSPPTMKTGPAGRWWPLIQTREGGAAPGSSPPPRRASARAHGGFGKPPPPNRNNPPPPPRRSHTPRGQEKPPQPTKSRKARRRPSAFSHD